jgi:hypothetical protein
MEALGIGSGCGATLQVGHGGEFPSKNPQDTMALMVKTKYKHTCNGPIFRGSADIDAIERPPFVCGAIESRRR